MKFIGHRKWMTSIFILMSMIMVITGCGTAATKASATTLPLVASTTKATSNTATTTTISSTTTAKATSSTTTAKVTTATTTQSKPTTSAATVATTAEKQEYVLNTSTKKIHYPSCRSVPTISAKNLKRVTSTRDELISQGYDPCGICKP